MSTAERDTATLPPLIHGQRLDRATFHERYEAMPPGVKAELIGGVVYMASPVGLPHGKSWVMTTVWVGMYQIRTPGVEAAGDSTTFLDDEGEPQPDVLLRILPECGGRTSNAGIYVDGGPELVIEVSDSTRRVDLGPKLADYERAGVPEYVVLAIDPDEIFWHVRREGRLVRIPPGPDGLYRSEIFPGLWLDPAALLANDGPALMAALDRGLATPEHREFVAELARARGGPEAPR